MGGVVKQLRWWFVFPRPVYQLERWGGGAVPLRHHLAAAFAPCIVFVPCRQTTDRDFVYSATALARVGASRAGLPDFDHWFCLTLMQQGEMDRQPVALSVSKGAPGLVVPA